MPTNKNFNCKINAINIKNTINFNRLFKYLYKMILYTNIHLFINFKLKRTLDHYM